MFRTFQIPVTWGELLKRTYKEINDDEVFGLAAQLAYYFLLALVPAIVCVIAVTSFLPATVLENIVQSLRSVAPGDVVQIVRDQLTSLSQGEHSGVFTFGLLMALWSSSAAMVSISDALNKAYDIEEGRPWWKVRLYAIGLTIGVAIFIVAAFALVMIGPSLIERIASSVGLSPVVTTVWNILRWPVAFALVAICVGLVFYFAPDAEQDWEWITPGAVIATVLWLVASLGFNFYISNFANYNESYGSLGGVIVLMLWFYISALAVLVGAEMNAEIEHASPHGKDPGEKVAGEKKKIGFAAKRAWEQRQKGKTSVQPQTPAAPRRRPSVAAFAIVGFGLFKQFRKKKAAA